MEESQRFSQLRDKTDTSTDRTAEARRMTSEAQGYISTQSTSSSEEEETVDVAYTQLIGVSHRMDSFESNIIDQCIK